MLTKHVERIVKADGHGFSHGAVLPKSSRYVSHFVEDGARRSTRMRIQAKSRSIGRPLKAHTALWTIYEKGWSSEGWVFLAPMIKDAAPVLLEQKSLFGEDFAETDTAFEFLQDAVNVVRTGMEDSERFDADLLLDFRMRSASANGVSEIKLFGVDRTDAQPADKVLSANAKALLSKIPDPQLVRIVGKLDMVKSSNSNFELLLTDGTRLKGVWQGDEISALGSFWDQEVTLDGVMVYKPNGKPLRIEGRTVRSPQERDLAFVPTRLSKVPQSLDIPKGVLTIGQLRGTWPGTETDEEIEEFFARVR